MHPKRAYSVFGAEITSAMLPEVWVFSVVLRINAKDAETAGRDAVGAPLERGASLKAAESGVLVALVRFLNHLECLYQESHPVVHETRTGVAIAA